MPGIQEASKVASTAVDALRTQPLALALIIINMLFLIAGGLFVYYLGTTIRAERVERAEAFAMIIKTCGPQARS